MEIRFQKKDQSAGSIDFVVIYLFQTLDNSPKIFAYITGDEQTALKENGLAQELKFNVVQDQIII